MQFFARSHTREEWLLLAAIGTAGMLGQYLMTISLMYGAIATVLIMDYALLLWTTLLSVMIWDQWPHPATWYGAPLIIMAGLIITWRAHRLSREDLQSWISPSMIAGRVLICGNEGSDPCP